GEDILAREAMMLGSNLAGIAFSTSSVALVHGMSRPIGAFFHVPHGLSNAMLLPTVTAFSLSAAATRYADCAKALGYAVMDDTVEQENQKLLAKHQAHNKKLKVPTLKEFGVKKRDFDKVVKIMALQAEASGSPGNNPRVPSQQEMIDLYNELWE